MARRFWETVRRFLYVVKVSLALLLGTVIVLVGGVFIGFSFDKRTGLVMNWRYSRQG
jgi:hypothetical protein